MTEEQKQIFEKAKDVPTTIKFVVCSFLRSEIGTLSSDDSNRNHYYEQSVINNLISLYLKAMKVFDSLILTADEQCILMDMLNNQTNNKFKYEWELLFRATEHGFKRDDFYRKCEQIPNTICVIKANKSRVFGGFTCSGWFKLKQIRYNKQKKDPSAFIYSIIRSQEKCHVEIFPVQDGKDINATTYDPVAYLSFGTNGNAFYIHSGIYSYGMTGTKCKDYNLEAYRLNGNHTDFNPKEIEVFRLLPT